MKKKLLITASALLAVFITINVVAFLRHLKKVHDIPISLPSPSVPPQAHHRAEVVVLSNDSCTVDGTRIGIIDLGVRLSSAKVDSVSLRAGRSVAPEALIPFLDAIRRAGIQQLSIDTSQP
jgi:biopolymer transport protein ExbD